MKTAELYRINTYIAQPALQLSTMNGSAKVEKVVINGHPNPPSNGISKKSTLLDTTPVAPGICKSKNLEEKRVWPLELRHEFFITDKKALLNLPILMKGEFIDPIFGPKPGGISKSKSNLVDVIVRNAVG